MKKIEKPLSADETLERISKQWANKRDIMDIGFCGDQTAKKIMNEIVDDLYNKGYRLPYKMIPMEAVVDYFKINTSYLKKISQKKSF